MVPLGFVIFSCIFHGMSVMRRGLMIVIAIIALLDFNGIKILRLFFDLRGKKSQKDQEDYGHITTTSFHNPDVNNETDGTS